MLKKTKSISQSVKKLLKSKKGYFVDTGVMILISVVLGALVLGGTYALANDTIMPTVKTKVEKMFDYSGTNNNKATVIDVEKYGSYGCRNVSRTDSGYTGGGEYVADGPAEKFVGIEVDGKPIDSTGYSVRENIYAYITFDKSTLDQLDAGSHTIKFIYQDGYAWGAFTMFESN